MNSNEDCVDVDECLGNNDCDSNAQCSNSVGNYVCSCKQGFIGDGKSCACESGFDIASNGTCVDVDECAEKNDCDKNAKCENNAGSYTCDCNHGFHGNGKTCECLGLTDSNGGCTVTNKDNGFIEKLVN